MTQREILIAGAGLGGLTAAAALAASGHRVQVFEQAPQLGEVGAGIQISANAARVLDSIGVLDRVEAVAAAPGEYRFRMFDDGETLQTIPLGDGYRERHGVPYLTVHRADLHAVLAERVEELAPGCIHLGNRVTALAEDEDGVTLSFDGHPDRRGECLIGADGIKSVVRRAVLGDTPAQYTGDVVWRVVVPTEVLPEEYRPRTVDIWVGPRRHAVTYPLRGGKLTNLVGCVEFDGLEDEGWTTPRPWEEMRADFEGWNPMISAIIEAAPKDECYRWALHIHPPVKRWTRGRITLLGDAAHPTLPYMAQGAAMSMEDGAVLARCLSEAGDVAGALDLYERSRLPRTTRIVTESSANRELFHIPSRDALRNAFAGRDMNTERNAWLFSYDALKVALG